MNDKTYLSPDNPWFIAVDVIGVGHVLGYNMFSKDEKYYLTTDRSDPFILGYANGEEAMTIAKRLYPCVKHLSNRTCMAIKHHFGK